MTADLERVRQAAGSTPDPEIRRSIGSMGLIDDVVLDGGHAVVKYHLTSPLCPAKFALKIGREIKRRVELLDGIVSCEVLLQDHFEIEEIDGLVNVRLLP